MALRFSTTFLQERTRIAFNATSVWKRCFSLYYLPKYRDSVRLWNEAYLDAEKYLQKANVSSGKDIFTVNYPLKVIGQLLSKDTDGYASIFKRALCLGHPLTRELKNLLYRDKLCFQLRFVTSLLVSASLPIKEDGKPIVSDSQLVLAASAEMLYVTSLVHRATLNLTVDHDDKNTLQKVNGFGILCGDLLIAHSLNLLATLRSPKIYGDISSAFSHSCQGIFEGQVDSQGNPFLPESGELDEWKQRTELYEGIILSATCKATSFLSGQSETTQLNAYQFAKNFIWAYQGSKELRNFTKDTETSSENRFCTASLPVLHQVQNDPELGQYLRSQSDLQRLDFDMIRRRVMARNAVDKTGRLIGQFVDDAEKHLRLFGDENTEAFQILLRMIRSLKEY